MVHVLILEQLLGSPQAARAPGAHGCYWSCDKSPGRRGSRRAAWGGGGCSWARCKAASWPLGAGGLRQSLGPIFEDGTCPGK